MAATDEGISIREFLEAQIEAIRREVAALGQRIDDTNGAHVKSHEREHAFTQIAVTKAEEALTARLETMNQFRQQINDRENRLATKDEIVAITNRLDDLNTVSNARITKVENFVISVQAQMATMRTLVILIPVVLTVVAFFLARGT